MLQETLELADDSLFVTQIKHKFKTADGALIVKAFAFSMDKSSEYKLNAQKAANLLLHQNADAITITCSLLAPLIWYDLTDIDEIQKNFGASISNELKELHSPLTLRFESGKYRRKEVAALLASFAKTPRQSILLITYRILALENAIERQQTLSQELAQETLDFYVPIANRLTLGELRRRLEDTCFRIIDPNGYNHLKKEVAPIQAEDDKCLDILMVRVQQILAENNIKSRIQGRTKSLHGIRRKMMRTGKALFQIMDRIGLRVIVQSVPECYTVLGLLHTHFKPIPDTFDDYIGLPKDNGYQSLHTCVYPTRDISPKPIEFQVRTELMHMEAEYGSAAHWQYKTETAQVKQEYDKTQWMKGLVRQHEIANSSETFVEILNRQVFRDHLLVFGNNGRIVRLAENATVRDYLTICNISASEIAAVKLNGKFTGLNQPLRDGDSVEILTGNPLPNRSSEINGFDSSKPDDTDLDSQHNIWVGPEKIQKSSRLAD